MNQTTATKAFTLNVAAANQPPVITQEPTANIQGPSVSFQIDAMDPELKKLSYLWDFGDGESGNTPTISHTYARTGIYAVSITVTDAANASVTRSLNVVVEAPGQLSKAAPTRIGSSAGISNSLLIPGAPAGCFTAEREARLFEAGGRVLRKFSAGTSCIGADSLPSREYELSIDGGDPIKIVVAN